MIEWSEIAQKIVSTGIVSGLGFLCVWIGRKIGWLFDTTRQNKTDLDAAFKKIRELEAWQNE